jgi:F0F1-type ATP synthase beta subunit
LKPRMVSFSGTYLPEQAFYMVGTIDEAFEKAKKIN